MLLAYIWVGASPTTHPHKADNAPLHPADSMQGRAQTQYRTIDDPSPDNLASTTIGCVLLREVQAADDRSVRNTQDFLGNIPGRAGQSC
eukprot:12908558-Prorocentrum_lima.AAC.1